MLRPDFEKRRFAFDLLSLADHWSEPETMKSIAQLARAVLESDPNSELVLLAPLSVKTKLDPELPTDRVRSYYIPLPDVLALRLYVQQTCVPVLLRYHKVNCVLSFGKGVPVLYPVPKVLALLPGQLKTWWKLIPAMLAADAVTVDSYALKEMLESKVPMRRSRVEVVTPSVGPEFHPYPKDASAELLDRLGIHGRFFLFLGDIGASSDCLVTLEAFAKIAHRPRVKSLNAVLVGPASSSVSSVRKRIEELGLTHRVVILENTEARTLPLLLSAAQFAIHPEPSQESPVLLLKALASACPVIVPSLRLRDSRFKPAVYACHQDDPKALAEAITEMLSEPELRDGLVKAGTEIVGLFSSDKQAEALLRIFDNRAEASGLIAARLPST
jgi:glycosyltransferase involved in cell wall biosynthesis